ncbi:hypothetical protein A2500_07195 [Candidatus Falkowbacteria bacterium RIFOXYC12_FULL_34_55]|nr:MAG: hypothetical protein A2500_07195 [Candidatus Falkowbacteria bacterium RIFOXYC12_FULL_34_55]
MKHASHIQMETLFAFWFAIMVIGWGSMIRTFRYIPKSNIVSKNFLNFFNLSLLLVLKIYFLKNALK